MRSKCEVVFSDKPEICFNPFFDSGIAFAFTLLPAGRALALKDTIFPYFIIGEEEPILHLLAPF